MAVAGRKNRASSRLAPTGTGSRSWARTTIHAFKGRCPTIRRSGNRRSERCLALSHPQMKLSAKHLWFADGRKKREGDPLSASRQCGANKQGAETRFESHLSPAIKCKRSAARKSTRRTQAKFHDSGKTLHETRTALHALLQPEYPSRILGDGLDAPARHAGKMLLLLRFARAQLRGLPQAQSRGRTAAGWPCRP